MDIVGNMRLSRGRPVLGRNNFAIQSDFPNTSPFLIVLFATFALLPRPFKKVAPPEKQWGLGRTEQNEQFV